MSINTSTTAGKIQVMQAELDGKVIQYKVLDVDDSWCEESMPHKVGWDWSAVIYRIKPQTVEEAYGDYMRNIEFLDTQSSFIAGSEWQKEQNSE